MPSEDSCELSPAPMLLESSGLGGGLGSAAAGSRAFTEPSSAWEDLGNNTTVCSAELGVQGGESKIMKAGIWDQCLTPGSAIPL